MANIIDELKAEAAAKAAQDQQQQQQLQSQQRLEQQRQADERRRTQEQQQQRQKQAEQERQKTQQQERQRTSKLREERLQRDKEAVQRQQKENLQKQKDRQLAKDRAQNAALAKQRTEEKRQQREIEADLRAASQEAQRKQSPQQSRPRETEREREPDREAGRDSAQKQPDMSNPAFLAPSHDTKDGTLEFHADGNSVFTTWRDQAIEKASEEGCSREQLGDLIEKDHDRGEVGEKEKFYEDLFEKFNVRSAFNERGEVEPWFQEHCADLDRKLEARKAELGIAPTREDKTQTVDGASKEPAREQDQENKTIEKGGAEKNEPAPEQMKEAAPKASEQAQETGQQRGQAEPEKVVPVRFSISESAQRTLDALGKNIKDPAVTVAEAKIPEPAAGTKSRLAEKLHEKDLTPARPGNAIDGPARQLGKVPRPQTKAEPELNVGKDRGPVTQAPKPGTVEQTRPIENLRERGQEARVDDRWKTQVHTERQWVDAKENRAFRETASRSDLKQIMPAPVAEQNPKEVQREKLPEGSAWVDHEKGVYLQKQPEHRYGTDYTNPGLRGQEVDVVRPVREAKTPDGNMEKQTYLAENKTWVKSEDHSKAVAEHLDAHRKEQPDLSADQKREQGVGQKWTRAIGIDKEGQVTGPVFVNRDGGLRVAERNPSQEAPWVTRNDPKQTVSEQFRESYKRQTPLEYSAEYQRTLDQPGADKTKSVAAEKADLGTERPELATKAPQGAEKKAPQPEKEPEVIQKPEVKQEPILEAEVEKPEPVKAQATEEPTTGRESKEISMLDRIVQETVPEKASAQAQVAEKPVSGQEQKEESMLDRIVSETKSARPESGQQKERDHDTGQER